MTPKVNEEIKDGNAVITFGGGDIISLSDKIKQTKRCAALLKGGTLPVKISFLEEKVINPVKLKDNNVKTKIIIIVILLIVIISLMIIYFLLDMHNSKQTQT
jgi:preprotein translocase subunit SecD